MAIVGFNFTKITAEKTGNVSGEVNISNNVTIIGASEIKVNLGDKDNKGLLLKFRYSCEYTPKIGSLTFEGDVVTLEKADVVKNCVDSWKKDKKIDEDITTRILSYVLSKSTVQAIIMSRDLSLPAPIPLPKITKKAPAKKK